MKLIVLTSKLVVLTLIVISIESLIWVGPHYFENHYLGIIQQKYDRLFNTSPGRIIIIGGSSGAFGFDSQKIESELGRPVVNMSIHAGIRLKYLLRGVEQWVEEGDIVIVSTVLSNLETRGDQVTSVLLKTYSFIPDDYVSSDLLLSAQIRFNYVQEKLGAESNRLFFSLLAGDANYDDQESIYQFGSFNSWGDVELPDEYAVKKFKVNDLLKNGTLLSYNARLLAEFSSRLNDKGARVFYASPPLYLPAVKDIEKVRRLFHQLEELPHLTVITSPEDYVFEDTLFYDTSDHLNTTGKQLRTDKLIADLKRNIGTSQ